MDGVGSFNCENYNFVMVNTHIEFLVLDLGNLSFGLHFLLKKLGYKTKEGREVIFNIFSPKWKKISTTFTKTEVNNIVLVYTIQAG